jgi:UDP-3-O-[3-hydroxymyristoyl] glucosamine N-acyltransferase
MIDPIFYIKINDKISYSTLETLLEKHVLSVNKISQTEFADFTTVDKAKNTDITFVHNEKYLTSIEKCEAGLILINENLYELTQFKNKPYLICKDVYSCCSILLNYFYSYKSHNFSDGGLIHKDALISKTAVIGANCYIGKVTIGENTIIMPNTVINDGVTIGDNVIIESNCSISYAIIYNNCYISPGCRIGSEGFGFTLGNSGPERIKHFGRVIINKNVSIGDNTVIHRGSLNDTVIGEGTKIDALVHIAHNVELGENCFVAAQTGFAGSSKVKNLVSFGGQCGIAGHITIGSNVRFAAKSGVTKNIKDNSGDYYGMPAIPKRMWQKTQIMLKKLSVKN